MHKSICWLLVGSLLFLGIGCRAPLELTEPPDKLEEVNKALADRWATIYLLDGAVLKHVDDVHIGRLETTYTPRVTEQEKAIPTVKIARVKVVSSSSGTPGLLIGAAPGILIFGAGMIGFASARGSEAQFPAGLLAALTTMFGAGLALGGGVLGLVLYNIVDDEKTIVVYEYPVSRYE